LKLEGLKVSKGSKDSCIKRDFPELKKIVEKLDRIIIFGCLCLNKIISYLYPFVYDVK
jgi:hypothetical protein